MLFKGTAVLAAIAVGQFTTGVGAWAPSSPGAALGHRAARMPTQAVCDVANADSAAATATTLRSLELTGADGHRTTLDGAMGVRTCLSLSTV
jgi:hypothetical protein